MKPCSSLARAIRLIAAPFAAVALAVLPLPRPSAQAATTSTGFGTQASPQARATPAVVSFAASSARSKHASARARHLAIDHASPPAAASAPPAAGMVIGIDPDSHTPAMPTPDQRARLAALAQRLTAPGARPAPVYHADGRVSLDVRSWMLDFAIVRRSASGRLVYTCVDGQDAAKRVSQDPPQDPAALEDR